MKYRHRHIRPKLKNLKPKRIFFKKPGFWLVAGFIAAGCGLYYGLFSQKLQVLGIKVLGNEKVTAAQIEDVAKASIKRELLSAGLFTISSRSILITNKKAVANDLLEKFPRIKEVSVKRSLLRNVIINVEERTPIAAYCRGMLTCFFIDNEGVIFEELKEIPSGMVIIRQEGGLAEASPGDSVIEAKIMAGIAEIEKSLRERFQVGIEEVLVSNPLIVKTVEGWKIYFDTERDMAGQIAKMNLLLKDEIPVEARKGIQYIYLQYKDRAYYK